MFDVLTVGRDRAELQTLENLLRQHDGVAVRQRQLSPTTPEPLTDTDTTPDLLVLSLDSESHQDLEALNLRPPHERPSVLVIGPEGDFDLMRLAMRAGARDFFFHPPNREELLDAVDRAIKEKESRDLNAQRHVTAVISAKGGAGGSFIATNIAHILASHFKAKTALLDMDLQFGYLAANFSVQANDGLQQALESIDTLDAVALEGWAAKHQSGVHIFGNTHRQLLLARDFSEEQLNRFFNLTTRTYAHVIIDVPRNIDHLLAACVERSNTVVLVMQQNVAQLRDARTLVNILQRELMLRDDQIIVVVNRWAKNALVSTKDIQKGLRTPHVTTIPNDYQQVSQSLNVGTPIFELNTKAAIARELTNLASTVGGFNVNKRGFLRRLFGPAKE